MHKSVDPASRSGLSFNASSPRSGLTAFLTHLKINVAKDEFSFTLNLLPTSPLPHFPTSQRGHLHLPNSCRIWPGRYRNSSLLRPIVTPSSPDPSLELGSSCSISQSSSSASSHSFPTLWREGPKCNTMVPRPCPRSLNCLPWFSG